MGLLTDLERIKKAGIISNYKDSFLNDKTAFDNELDNILDASKLYGNLQKFIDNQTVKINAMEALKVGMAPGDQAEIDILITVGNNKINQMKARYTTEIYNKIHG